MGVFVYNLGPGQPRILSSSLDPKVIKGRSRGHLSSQSCSLPTATIGGRVLGAWQGSPGMGLRVCAHPCDEVGSARGGLN